MKMVLIAVLAIMAFLGGAIGGDLLHSSGAKPPEAGAAKEQDPEAEAPASADHAPAATDGTQKSASGDWFAFPNQFFVPVMRNGATTAVMVLSLTLETTAEARPRIEAQEHRLRDAMLGTLMIRANTGTFDGNFTAEANMTGLRKALLEAAQDAAGPDVTGVLIGDIARQDQ